jgi:hypothetical protein
MTNKRCLNKLTNKEFLYEVLESRSNNLSWHEKDKKYRIFNLNSTGMTYVDEDRFLSIFTVL